MKFDTILNAGTRKEIFLIPREMVVSGSIQSDTPGQIGGIINGDVLVNGRIILLKEGIINGDVSAEELIVHGRINGDVKKCNKVSVQSGALIKGNITTAEIHIEKEAVIEGLITKSGVQQVAQKKKEATRKYEVPGETTQPAPAGNNILDRQAWF